MIGIFFLLGEVYQHFMILRRSAKGKDTYFCLKPLLSQIKAKGNAHVYIPNHRIYQLGMPLQAALAKLHLALAMPAVVTLPAPFLVNHRVTATLLTKIASDAQMTQA